MLSIQNNAVKYAKKENGNFLIRSYSNSVTCWSNNTTTVAGLRIEIVKDFIKEDVYNEYEYDGVKVYVESSLIVNDSAYIFIFKLPKNPFMRPFFVAKGIESKKY